jgi:hypothetical protein
MATHNTGTTATRGQSAHTVAFTFTVPAGVLAGDVMIVGINTFSFPLTGPATTTPTSGGGSWTAIGPLVAAQNGVAGTFATAWYRVATAGDPGSTFTISWSGGVGGTDGFWWTAVMDAYSGFWTADPIAQSITPTSGAETAVGASPSGTTLRAGSWVVQLGPITPNSGGTITGVPAGMTQRQLSNGNSGVSCASADSAGSAGAAGTAIGGGSFTSSNAPDNWWAQWTIELATIGAGGPVTVTAPVAPPLILPHPHFTEMLLGEAWQRADWQAQGVADLSVSYASTASGIDTYNVLSPWNGGATQQMRVLAPAAPNAGYPHAFLIMLPVAQNQDATYGDPITVAQGLGANDAYNLTCVQPGYTAAGGGEGPWYADNPLNPAISYEKYTLLITAWIKANLAVTGNEAVYLIGFSRSGLGGQGLQFRHPDVYAATASWDFPAMMADYDGTDPTNGSSIGGSPALFYGTSANFQRYALSAANLATWAATGQFAVNRLWLGLGPAFGADPPAYDTALTAAGIPHAYGFASTSESHAWHADWVAAALAAIIPSGQAQATTMLPQQVPHPLLEAMLDLASLRLDPGSPPPVIAALAGDATTVPSAAGSLAQAMALAGTAPDTASAAGALTQAMALSGTAPDTAATAGSLAWTAVLSGTAPDAATAAGALAWLAALAGGAASAGVTAGSLAQAMTLSGAASSASPAAGALAQAMTLGGTAPGAATTAGALTWPAPVTGTAASPSAASGALAWTAVLAGASSSASAAAGNLTVASGAVNWSIAGTSATTGTTTGALAWTAALAGTASSASTGTGALTWAAVLSGTSATAATAAGALTGALAIAGTGTSPSAASGALAWQAAIAGTSASPSVASGALGPSGALTGAAATAGTAAGALAQALAVTGASVTTVTSAGGLAWTAIAGGTAASGTSATGTFTARLTIAGASVTVTVCAGAVLSGIFLTGTAVTVTITAGSFTVTFLLITAGRIVPQARAGIIASQVTAGEVST